MNFRTTIVVSAAVVIGLVSGRFPAAADEFIVDQGSEFDLNHPVQLYGIPAWSVGQEFTPTTNAVDFVDVLTKPGGTGTDVTLQVLIRQISIVGPVLGASDLLVLTNAGQLTNRFRFSPRIALNPGSNYVIEVLALGVDPRLLYWFLFGNPVPLGSGRMIVNGSVASDRNLWFREGIVVPAPDSPLLSIRVSHVSVCWSSSTGKTYQVQYRSGLTTNIWTDLGSPVPGNGLTNCVTDAISGPTRFYRVLTLE